MNSIRVMTLTLGLLLAGCLPTWAQGGRYTVQVQATPSQATAEERVKQLKAQGLDAYWIKSDLSGKGVLYRVRVGRFATLAAAKDYGERLRAKGVIETFYAAGYEGVPQPAAGGPKNPTPPVPATGPTAASKGATNTPQVSPPAVPPSVSGPPAARTPTGEAPKATKTPMAALAPGYSRFEDDSVGYSFDYPSYWTGSAFRGPEAQAQNIDAGASFKSNQDAAFLNAIWNSLPDANSPAHDNNLIVDMIIKSMGTGSETQSLTETSRRVVTEGNQIKTRVDLRAFFRDSRAPAPLEFLGKAMIIRSSKGILMVAVFYAKDGPAGAASVADRIVSSARVLN